MKQFAMLVVATLIAGTLLMACDSSPAPQNAEDRAMSEGRRESPDPIAPPGPPGGGVMVPDEDTPAPSDDDE